MTKLLQKFKTSTQNDKAVKEQCYMSRSFKVEGHIDVCEKVMT